MPYIAKSKTPAQVVGDAEVKEGKNGKPYRIVPVRMLGNRRTYAFTNYAPEVGSFVMLEITGRADNLSYSVVSPTVDDVKFMAEACEYWK